MAGKGGHIRYRRLGAEDIATVLAADDSVFDNRPERSQAQAFLSRPDNILIAAFDGSRMVGMATGTMLFHPDKPPAFFVQEIGTAESHRRRGIASRLLELLLDAARAAGSDGIWLGTEIDNNAARGLYRKLGAGEHMGFVLYDWDGGLGEVDDPG